MKILAIFSLKVLTFPPIEAIPTICPRFFLIMSFKNTRVVFKQTLIMKNNAIRIKSLKMYVLPKNAM